MTQDRVLRSDELRSEVDDRKWRDLLEAGSRRAQALGLTEDDVPRLVAEARRDRRSL
jgi:hypothetical protein